MKSPAAISDGKGSFNIRETLGFPCLSRNGRVLSGLLYNFHHCEFTRIPCGGHCVEFFDLAVLIVGGFPCRVVNVGEELKAKTFFWVRLLLIQIIHAPFNPKNTSPVLLSTAKPSRAPVNLGGPHLSYAQVIHMVKFKGCGWFHLPVAQADALPWNHLWGEDRR